MKYKQVKGRRTKLLENQIGRQSTKEETITTTNDDDIQDGDVRVSKNAYDAFVLG